MEAALQTIEPTNGRSEIAPRAASPAARAAGRLPGATLWRSFCPSRRKSAPIPNTLAAIATAPNRITIGTDSGGGRSASAETDARRSVRTPSAPARSVRGHSLSAEAAARAKGDAKKKRRARLTASQTESPMRRRPRDSRTWLPSCHGGRCVSSRYSRRSVPGVETMPRTGKGLPAGTVTPPPKTERFPPPNPDGSNVTLPPQTTTSPSTGAAMRTSDRTATTRPATGRRISMSLAKVVCPEAVAAAAADMDEAARSSRSAAITAGSPGRRRAARPRRREPEGAGRRDRSPARAEWPGPGPPAPRGRQPRDQGTTGLRRARARLPERGRRRQDPPGRAPICPATPARPDPRRTGRRQEGTVLSRARNHGAPGPKTGAGAGPCRRDREVGQDPGTVLRPTIPGDLPDCRARGPGPPPRKPWRNRKSRRGSAPRRRRHKRAEPHRRGPRHPADPTDGRKSSR